MGRSQSSPVGDIIAGGLFALLGTAFLFIGLWPAFQALQTRSWLEIPCVIERFEISDHPDAKPVFRPEIAYRFEWQGKAFTGSRLWPRQEGENDYESLAELRTRFGSELPRPAICRVNSRDATQSAILPEPVSPYTPVIVGFCGAFIFAGVSIARAGWRKRRGRSTADVGQTVSLTVFSFMILGGGFVMWMSARSLRNNRSAWERTPATMIWSRLETLQSKGTSYRVNVFYRYRFHGRDYASSTFDAGGASTPTKEAKQAFVKAHPAGTSFTCFVNPRAPWRSVVTHDRSSGWLELLIFGLPLCGVGLWGIWWTLRTFRSASLTIRRAIPKESWRN